PLLASPLSSLYFSTPSSRTSHKKAAKRERSLIHLPPCFFRLVLEKRNRNPLAAATLSRHFYFPSPIQENEDLDILFSPNAGSCSSSSLETARERERNDDGDGDGDERRR
ncbi:unnamed protein product, partial [Linum tenue]